ncbi:MAG TPA: hypothetical protein VI958_01225, partial [Acidobacteriota bacterium]
SGWSNRFNLCARKRFLNRKERKGRKESNLETLRSLRPLRFMFRIIVYLWVSAASVLGLLFALLALISGGGAHRFHGVLSSVYPALSSREHTRNEGASAQADAPTYLARFVMK